MNCINCKKQYQNKISPIINQTTETQQKVLADNKYYKITQNIRNTQKLSKEEFEYMINLPRENLIEIIKIYDMYIDIIHELLDI